MDNDQGELRSGLYMIWKRDLENAKASLTDMDREDFVTWFKQKKNRDLVNMELDQERTKNVSDQATLYSWMKWQKNLALVESQNSLALKTKQETLNLVIEVAAEASLHFFIQVLLVLPDLILNSSRHETSSYIEKAKELVNWQVMSILSSFATMANSYSRIQILEKEYALSWTGNPKALLLLFSFTTFNTICRTMICGCFVYLTNPDGHFEILKAVSLYYSHILIMLFFNTIFNRDSPSLSLRYIISLLLNSMTSFYSYNYYDFFNIGHKHQPTFLRQLVYFLIIITENVALTMFFVLYPSSYNIEDTYGNVHQLSSKTVIGIVIFLIILQTLSILCNVLYYANHPASVSLTDLQDKMRIHILGTSWVWKNGRWIKEQVEKWNKDLEMGTSLEELYNIHVTSK